MKIDHKTMMWQDIHPGIQSEMRQVAEDIVLRGKVPYPLPVWLQEWMDVFGYTDRQSLLVISTLVPQRILLSLLVETDKTRLC